MRLVAKHATIGYILPSDRPGCRNCRFLTDATPENGINLVPRPYCAKHGVEVTAGAICNTYQVNTSPTQGMAAMTRQLDLLRQVADPIPNMEIAQ